MTLAAAIARLAERLDRAELDVTPVARITDEYPDLDLEDAYAIQRAIRDRKVARGARIAGLKMGLTSHAKMKQLGVDTSIDGFLTEEGRRSDGAAVRTKGLIRRMVATGSGADVLGHPAAAVAMLANMLAARGERVPAGSFILSGGMTEAVPVAAGDRIDARFQELGSVAVRFD